MQNCLVKARLGRSAARQLNAMRVNDVPITGEELARLLRRIEDGFDAVLGVAPPPPEPTRGPFTVVRGGVQ